MDNGGITPVVNLNPTGTSPAYTMPIMPYGYGGFGGGGFGNGLDGIYALAMLAILFNGGFGGFGGGNGFANAIGYENLATSNEVQRGFDNQNAMANQREILSAVTSGTAQTVSAINGTFHDTISVLSDKYTELQRDIAALNVGQANLLAQENACCCAVQRSIDNLSYQGAMNTASINANTTAQTQKILDAITENKIEALRGRINELELKENLSNVVRYPDSFVYATPNPFFNCNSGCGCGNI